MDFNVNTVQNFVSLTSCAISKCLHAPPQHRTATVTMFRFEINRHFSRPTTYRIGRRRRNWSSDRALKVTGTLNRSNQVLALSVSIPCNNLLFILSISCEKRSQITERGAFIIHRFLSPHPQVLTSVYFYVLRITYFFLCCTKLHYQTALVHLYSEGPTFETQPRLTD
jgi:hypothetical protein